MPLLRMGPTYTERSWCSAGVSGFPWGHRSSAVKGLAEPNPVDRILLLVVNVVVTFPIIVGVTARCNRPMKGTILGA